MEWRPDLLCSVLLPLQAFFSPSFFSPLPQVATLGPPWTMWQYQDFYSSLKLRRTGRLGGVRACVIHCITITSFCPRWTCYHGLVINNG